MTDARAQKLLDILQNCYRPREDGWLWLGLFDDYSSGGIVQEVTGQYEDPPATATTLAGLVDVAEGHQAYLAVCRPGARPDEMDRELWHEFRRRVDNERLIDMVVFNKREVWSMRDEDAASNVA